MGNPAAERRKLTEKRRKRHEARLGPGAYLPKADREALQAELKRIAALPKKPRRPKPEAPPAAPKA